MLYKLLLLINLFNITSACLSSATNDGGTVPITESPGGDTTTASSGTTTVSSGTTTASSGTTTVSSGTTTASSGITSVATTTTTSNAVINKAGCQFNTLTNSQRDLVAQLHNDFRSMLAMGEAAEPNGNLSPGKNIYKLKYNCDLENLAQAKANNCSNTKFVSSIQGSSGENLYRSNGTESNDAALQSSTSAWWGQLRSGNINKTNPVFRNPIFIKILLGFTPDVGNFAQMAWADTLTVGCGVGHCSANPTMVVCNYAKAGRIVGKNIYQVGAPCSGCTTFAGSTCDSDLGLCVAPDANYQNPF